MTDFQITIIGAGIIGLAVARELSLSGKKVLVIEKILHLVKKIVPEIVVLFMQDYTIHTKVLKINFVA